MKKITIPTLALAVAMGTAMPVAAQQNATRLEGESAMQMATRLGLCGDSALRSAQFVDNGSTLQASCAPRVAGGNTGAGGLGTGGAIAAGVGLAAVIGIAAASSSSSGTTN